MPTDHIEESGSAIKVLRTLDIAKILSYLPHRYPFLMLDRYEIIQEEIEGIGIKNVTFNEPQFQGHFPDLPVMPGVLTLEAMAQAAGIAVISSGGELAESKPHVLLTSIDKAKFRGVIQPGDQLKLHVKRISSKRMVWKYNAQGWVNNKLVAEAEIGAMVRS